MGKASEIPLYLRAHTRPRSGTTARPVRRPRKRQDLPQDALLLSGQNQVEHGSSELIGSFQLMDGWKTISCGLICSDSATEDDLDSIASRKSRSQ